MGLKWTGWTEWTGMEWTMEDGLKWTGWTDRMDRNEWTDGQEWNGQDGQEWNGQDGQAPKRNLFWKTRPFVHSFLSMSIHPSISVQYSSIPFHSCPFSPSSISVLSLVHLQARCLMPKRTDIKKILLIGSAALSSGKAANLIIPECRPAKS